MKKFLFVTIIFSLFLFYPSNIFAQDTPAPEAEEEATEPTNETESDTEEATTGSLTSREECDEELDKLTGEDGYLAKMRDASFQINTNYDTFWKRKPNWIIGLDILSKPLRQIVKLGANFRIPACIVIPSGLIAGIGGPLCGGVDDFVRAQQALRYLEDLRKYKENIDQYRKKPVLDQLRNWDNERAAEIEKYLNDADNYYVTKTCLKYLDQMIDNRKKAEESFHRLQQNCDQYFKERFSADAPKYNPDLGMAHYGDWQEFQDVVNRDFQISNLSLSTPPDAYRDDSGLWSNIFQTIWKVIESIFKAIYNLVGTLLERVMQMS